jgi:hypothetical protein
MVLPQYITEEIHRLVGGKMCRGSLKTTLEKKLNVQGKITNIQSKAKNLHTALRRLTMKIEILGAKKIGQRVPRADTQQNVAESK